MKTDCSFGRLKNIKLKFSTEAEPVEARHMTHFDKWFLSLPKGSGFFEDNCLLKTVHSKLTFQL